MQAIQKEILLNGPITAVMAVYKGPGAFDSELSKHMESGDLYKENKTAHVHGYHAVKIVGWGTACDTDYWLVAKYSFPI